MKAFIDHIQDDFAIIHLEDGKTELKIPLCFLPEGAREGSWLTISFNLDPEGTRKQEELILKLLGKLKKKGRD